jgi:2-octaprenyl-6-methoxyphenol hydroxylase
MAEVPVPEADVAIVGAGLSGAGLACALAPLGLRIALFETTASGAAGHASKDRRMFALALGSVRILGALGLWAPIAAQATAIRRVHVSERGGFGFVRLDAADAGLEALGYTIAAARIGALLHRTMSGLPGVNLHAPARVKEVRMVNGRAELEIEGDAPPVLRAGVVVLADGGRSALREQLGIRAAIRPYGHHAVLSRVRAELPHAHTAYERFLEDGAFALLPHTGNEYALIWTVPEARAGEVLSLDDTRFLAAIQEVFGDRAGRLSQPGPRVSYPLSSVAVDDPARARAVAIGNAAHILHPVAAQGFNLGLRDIAALAQVWRDALVAGEDIGAPEVLRRYADWRRRDVSWTGTLTDGLIQAFRPRFPPAASVRALGMLALDALPFARRALMRQAMGLSGRLPDLALGLALSSP